LLSKEGAVAVVEAAFPQLSHEQVVGIVNGVNDNAQPVGVTPTLMEPTTGEIENVPAADA
jgi:hypothetical protein